MRKIFSLVFSTMLAIVGVQFVGITAAQAATYTYSIDCNRQYYSLDASSPNTDINITLAPGDTVTFNQVQASGTNGFCTNLYTVQNLADFFSTYPTAPMGNPITFVVKPGAAAVTNARIAMYTLLIGGGATNGRQFYFSIASTNKTVTFNANGGTGSMNAQAASSATNLTANSFLRTGYAFAGWNTASNGSGTAYANSASFPFSADTTLYAQWTVVPKVVTFNANGGTGVMATQSGSSAANLTANSFVQTGYTFSGWNTAANGSGTAYANNASYAFSADVTLYAQWTVVPKVVTFNANGGTGVMATQSGSSAANLSSNSFVQSNYLFNGWNTAANGSGTGYADGASYPFASDVTLYAQWTPAQMNVQQQAPAQPQAPSNGVQIEGIKLGTSGSANVITIMGNQFSTDMTVTVGGKPAKILTSATGEITIVIPEGLTGYQTLVISTANKSYSFEGRIKLASTAATSGQAATSVFKLTNFDRGSSKLTATMRRQLATFAATVASGSKISCVGFAGGPTRLASDPALALARARSACNYLLAALSGRAQASLSGKTSLATDAASRRVEISLKG